MIFGKREFESALRQTRVGDELLYWHGHLGHERLLDKGVDHCAKAAMAAYERGDVILYQRRSFDAFDYIARRIKNVGPQKFMGCYDAVFLRGKH